MIKRSFWYFRHLQQLDQSHAIEAALYAQLFSGKQDMFSGVRSNRFHGAQSNRPIGLLQIGRVPPGTNCSSQHLGVWGLDKKTALRLADNR